MIKYTCGAGTPEEAETNCTYFIRGECTASFCEYRRKKQTNADRLMSMDDASKRDSLLNFFREWAGIGDSYIYDLTRIKTAFDVGTMSLDDFEEWDDGRITRLVDDFLGWIQHPAEEG